MPRIFFVIPYICAYLLLFIPVRFKGTVKRVKNPMELFFAPLLQNELNSDDVERFTTHELKPFNFIYCIDW